MSKKCNNCGKVIANTFNKCPYCASTDFSSVAVQTGSSNAAPVSYNQSLSDKIEHALFYWVENNYYVFSRTKFLTILVFLVCFISFGLYDGIFRGIFFGLLFAIPTAVVGVIIHYLNRHKVNYYSDGLRENIYHFLLYWWNGSEFVIAKTKLFTLMVFIVFLMLGFIADFEYARLAIGSILGIIFAIPVFIVGFIIHKLTFKTNAQRVTATANNYSKLAEIKKEPVNELAVNNIPKFEGYKNKLNNLKSEFDDKESKTKELIEMRFQPPQLTYDHFMSTLGSCSNLFNTHYDSASSIIDLATADSNRIGDELDSKINILESLIDKLDELSNELVLNMSKSDDGDVQNVLEDMEHLIDSIDNYNND